MRTLPEEDVEKLKKANRIKRLSPKTHRIAVESGRSLKTLWMHINKKANK